MSVTGLADLTLRSGHSLREKFLLKRGDFFLILSLDLIIDGIHKPNVKLMAILMPLPLEHRRLLLNKLHQFACRYGFILLALAHRLEKLFEVEKDSLGETE